MHETKWKYHTLGMSSYRCVNTSCSAKQDLYVKRKKVVCDCRVDKYNKVVLVEKREKKKKCTNIGQQYIGQRLIILTLWNKTKLV